MSSITLAYKENLKSLSDELIRIQKPIQILDAIKWPRELERQFLQHPHSLPKVDQAFYQNRPLSFYPPELKLALLDLKVAIRRKLGHRDKLGKILSKTADQYLLVIEMLENRGNQRFGEISTQLYGSSQHKLHGDRHSIKQLGDRLSYLFSLPAAKRANRQHPKVLDAEHAVNELSQRLNRYFHSDEIRVRLSDGIMSDAAVGGDTIKISTHAKFSEADLNIYEVHEGWVHVGTTLNGRMQPYATWLGVGSPRVAATQEGLAVLLEMLTLSSTPGRARRISDRIEAVSMAENGADFIEVFRYFREQNLSETDSYRITQRVFRGGDVSGGSYFTKDISYVRGYVENVNFIRAAITAGLPELIPMLFVGKLAIEDIPTLYQAQKLGVIEAPQYLPPMFDDYSGLYAWFGFAAGLAEINLKGVQRHFQRLFKDLPTIDPISEFTDETEFDNNSD
ncbi:flavohemoglobin expression-modulating QEGLA motif protein [Shewanella sp. NIFS-20-20]|uniref:flavohemoglobin expression-modulating QEGLA motif protein n=1 Tax=Shewanella sp. NIFS-20-20 TaxID=2853806 RepID=UPI001C45980E|nr:flavohemoglobin expression-modulating QEGLA motif protein [Shewanella sp. NIFS-20-20]MBV7317545.1 flavohemoglobin expression-modulating QEGLA motif protein [Shewanella sp. NIFS-20-20]